MRRFSNRTVFLLPFSLYIDNKRPTRKHKNRLYCFAPSDCEEWETATTFFGTVVNTIGGEVIRSTSSGTTKRECVSDP